MSAMTDKTKSASQVNQAPVAEGLYVFPPEVKEPALLGSKCRACGLVMWPKQAVCAKCLSHDTEEVPLSRTGTVWSSTVVRQAPGEYRGPVPYAIGLVELPEGAGVRTVFTGCSADEPLAIGTEVELVFEEVGQGSEGESLIGHKFAPIKRAS
jgi:uncharacterized OB-fold protein